MVATLPTTLAHARNGLASEDRHLLKLAVQNFPRAEPKPVFQISPTPSRELCLPRGTTPRRSFPGGPSASYSPRSKPTFPRWVPLRTSAARSEGQTTHPKERLQRLSPKKRRHRTQPRGAFGGQDWPCDRNASIMRERCGLAVSQLRQWFSDATPMSLQRARITAKPAWTPGS